MFMLCNLKTKARSLHTGDFRASPGLIRDVLDWRPNFVLSPYFDRDARLLGNGLQTESKYPASGSPSPKSDLIEIPEATLEDSFGDFDCSIPTKEDSEAAPKENYFNFSSPNVKTELIRRECNVPADTEGTIDSGLPAKNGCITDKEITPYEVNTNVLNEIVQYPLQHIYLDNTYANSDYAFPSQEEAINGCLRVVTQRIKRDQTLFTPIKRLYLVGSYTIGKERIALSLARLLNTKIYVRDPKKRRIFLNCLDWPQFTELITEDPVGAAVHIVPVADIDPKKIGEILTKHWPAYTHAIGVRPTGWTFSSPKGSKAVPSSSKTISESADSAPKLHNYVRVNELGDEIKSKDAIMIIQVPYSEHSSFSELVTFVDTVAPKSDCMIIPTVSNAGSFFLRRSDYDCGYDLLLAWENRYTLPDPKLDCDLP